MADTQEEEIQMEADRRALEVLHGACQYLRTLWSNELPRNKAKSNLDARAILFNCSNKILQSNRMGITREEVEGAAILERSSR